jgi:integrase/recombinase XerD
VKTCEQENAMNVKTAVEEYGYSILHLSPHTQRWYKEKLATFCRWCQAEGLELEQIKTTTINRFIEHLRTTPGENTGKPRSTYTIHGYAEVLRTFIRWCASEEYLSGRALNQFKMPGVEKKVIETFTPAQIKALFASCAKEFYPSLRQRDRAILATLLDTGIRASELCGLTMDRTHLEGGDPHILVIGKGKKQREIGLPDTARLQILRYVRRSRLIIPGQDHTFLGREGETLTESGLYQIIDRLGEWAHVQGVRCSPHTFRHTFAINYLLAGGDIYDLSRLLGHSTIKTTEIYLETFKSIHARRTRISVSKFMDGAC